MAMKVYINHKPICIFAGARILDAIRAYSAVSLKQVQNESLVILDRFGNLTEPDGPLQDGQRLYLKRNKQLP